MSASILNQERYSWTGEADQEGHRTYKLGIKVVTTSKHDGPYNVMHCPGLPLTGTSWNFGLDSDPWAFCYPTMSAKLLASDDHGGGYYWAVEKTFSTKPLSRCQDESIEDPLLEPQKVGGSFANYTKEATVDRNGLAIRTSSDELVRGPQVEFDDHRPIVWVEQNVATLGLETFSDMMNKVNDDLLWGMAARKVKLSTASWERKLYGVCNYYYTRRFEFQLNSETFDRNDVIDEGTRAKGYWNPTTRVWVNAGDVFNQYRDQNGSLCRVLLDGAGSRLADGAAPVNIPRCPIEYYKERNFLLLGIPLAF